MRAKSWWFTVTAFLCIGVAGCALWAYGGGAQRVPLHPGMAVAFKEHRVLITVHATGASIALILGPFQFLERWRARHLRLHRMMGYGYLALGVGMGGTAGVLMATYFPFENIYPAIAWFCWVPNLIIVECFTKRPALRPASTLAA